MKKSEKSTKTSKIEQKGQKMKQARSKVPHNRGRTVMWVILLMVWVFCAVVVSQLLVGWIMGLLLSETQLSQPVWSGAYMVVSYGLALLLILLVPPRVAKSWSFKLDTKKHKIDARGQDDGTVTTAEEIGLKEPLGWTDIGLAPVAYVVALVLGAGLAALFQLFPWFDLAEAQNTGFTPYMDSVQRVIGFIVLVVIAPVVEEVIFRGWLYGKMRSRLSAPLSILLVSLLFGLVHFQWNVGVNVFALSVVLCVLREITGTIWAGILTHMLKNGVAFYLLYVLVL